MPSSEDYVHARCLDCGKKFDDKWAYRNPFLQEGKAASCTACGGVVVPLDDRNAAHAIAKSQQQRGIGVESRPTLEDHEDGYEPYKVPELED